MILQRSHFRVAPWKRLTPLSGDSKGTNREVLNGVSADGVEVQFLISSKLQLLAIGLGERGENRETPPQTNKEKRRKTKKTKRKTNKNKQKEAMKNGANGKNPSNPVYTNPMKNLPSQIQNYEDQL